MLNETKNANIDNETIDAICNMIDRTFDEIATMFNNDDDIKNSMFDVVTTFANDDDDDDENNEFAMMKLSMM